jgi:YHS domain-containing protein
MGKPVSIRYKGRTVQFCCKMCVKKFEADPAKYLAALPGEQGTAR